MPLNILFVCLGNICRSPAAEGIMIRKVEEAGLSSEIFIDSAGTHAYHAGERADKRMISHAANKGYDLQSIARKFDPHSDYQKYDYILAMDGENYNDLISMDINKRYKEKIFLITDFCSKVQASEVPDPYYGGDKGFELVITILEDACEGLLNKIKDDIKLHKR